MEEDQSRPSALYTKHAAMSATLSAEQSQAAIQRVTEWALSLMRSGCSSGPNDAVYEFVGHRLLELVYGPAAMTAVLEDRTNDSERKAAEAKAELARLRCERVHAAVQRARQQRALPDSDPGGRIQ